MKFIVAHTLAFLFALSAFSLYIVSFNTPFYSISKKCKLQPRMRCWSAHCCLQIDAFSLSLRRLHQGIGRHRCSPAGCYPLEHHR